MSRDPRHTVRAGPVRIVRGGAGELRVAQRRDTNLSALGMTELLALRDRIDAEIEARRSASEEALRRKGGLVERDGPRYCNPENSADTWSGRGKRPAWVDRALAKGFTLEQLEIVDDRPGRAATEIR